MTVTVMRDDELFGAKPGSLLDEKIVTDPASAVDVGDIIEPFSGSGCWEAETQEYLSGLTKVLSNESRAIPISVKVMDSRTDCMVFSANDKALVLAFDLASQTLPQLLDNVYIKTVSLRFKKAHPTKTLLNVVLVNSAMLGRMNNMIRYIDNMITSANTERVAKVSLSDFGKELDPNTLAVVKAAKYRISINTSTADMRNWMDKFSPQAAVARSYGFVASLVENHPEYGKDSTDRELFAVSAYTEFIHDRVNSTPDRLVFTPRVHITEISSTLYSESILTLIIPIAADYLVGKSLWKKEFEGIGDSAVNLGNLFGLDENGNLEKTETVQQLENIYNNHLTQLNGNTQVQVKGVAAQLVVDIQVGGTNLPGLIDLISGDTDITSAFSKFLGVVSELPASRLAIASVVSDEVGALVETSTTNEFSKSTLVDLRQYTYLYLCSTLIYDPKFADFLSDKMLSPTDRFNAMEFLRPSIVTGHIIHAAIDGEVVNDIARLINRTVSVSGGEYDEQYMSFNPSGKRAYGASVFQKENDVSYNVRIPTFK